MSLNFQKFEKAMEGLGLGGRRSLAVAVSGGPDSMALCSLLSRWALERGVQVHALTVDHGLRIEAKAEAEQVGEWLSGAAHITHHVLKWEHEGVGARVQEAARAARYDLMAAHCRAHNIGALITAHHMDDQAETLLFRLSKGSGLDGLSGMAAVYDLGGGVTLYRPFLDVSKDKILAFCADEAIKFLSDPSNENSDFARVRLRHAREALEAEGLSNKRLAVTAKRLARAREALEILSLNTFHECMINNNSKRIELNLKTLSEHPEEIVLRVVMKGMEKIALSAGYGPRFEKVEALVFDLLQGGDFRKRTLGGVIFEVDPAEGILSLRRENP